MNMADYPIAQQKDLAATSPANEQLPAFYMEDFSIMGFRVDDCPRAIQLLEQNGFGLTRCHDMVAVKIDGSGRVREVVKLLRARGLACEMADLAEGIYQG
jgi:hypothetical protein